jgi:hypothetical protein
MWRGVSIQGVRKVFSPIYHFNSLCSLRWHANTFSVCSVRQWRTVRLVQHCVLTVRPNLTTVIASISWMTDSTKETAIYIAHSINIPKKLWIEVIRLRRGLHFVLSRSLTHKYPWKRNNQLLDVFFDVTMATPLFTLHKGMQWFEFICWSEERMQRNNCSPIHCLLCTRTFIQRSNTDIVQH